VRYSWRSRQSRVQRRVIVWIVPMRPRRCDIARWVWYLWVISGTPLGWPCSFCVGLCADVSRSGFWLRCRFWVVERGTCRLVWHRWLPTCCRANCGGRTCGVPISRPTLPWGRRCQWRWCIWMIWQLPLLALLAVPALDAELLLETAGDVAPFGETTALEDELQPAVLLCCPWTTLWHSPKF
jgi:hypothetical protein